MSTWGGVHSLMHHIKTNLMARLKPKIKCQRVGQTPEMTNLGFTLEAFHKYSSSTLPQPQKKKELQPQRYQVKWCANEFQTWPLCSADRRRHFLVLDWHLFRSPSPFISLLLSIYWIRNLNPERGHLVGLSISIYSIVMSGSEDLLPASHGNTCELCEVPHKLPESTIYGVRGWFLGIHFMF